MSPNTESSPDSDSDPKDRRRADDRPEEPPKRPDGTPLDLSSGTERTAPSTGPEAAIIARIKDYDGEFPSERELTRWSRNAAVMLAAISEYSRCIRIASFELRNDAAFMLEALRAAPGHQESPMRWASHRLRRDNAFIATAIEVSPGALSYAVSSLKRSPELILRALSVKGAQKDELMRLLHPNDLGDPAFVSRLVEVEPTGLRHAHPRFRAVRALAVSAVARDVSLFDDLDPSLRDDAEVVLSMLARPDGGYRIGQVSPRLLSDPVFVLEAARLIGARAVVAASEYVVPDRETLLVGLRADVEHALRNPDRGRWGETFVAVRTDPRLSVTLSDIPLELRSDREVLGLLVLANPREISNVPLELRADIRFMLPLVEVYGNLLEFAGGDLNDRDELVEAAVSSCGGALRHASFRHRDTESTVARAIGHDPLALGYSSPAIHLNADLAVMALEAVIRRFDPEATGSFRALRYDPPESSALPDLSRPVMIEISGDPDRKEVLRTLHGTGPTRDEARETLAELWNIFPLEIRRLERIASVIRQYFSNISEWATRPVDPASRPPQSLQHFRTAVVANPRDPAVAIEAARHGVPVLAIVDEPLRANRELVFYSAAAHPSEVLRAAGSITENADLMLQLVRVTLRVLDYLPERHFDDPQFLTAVSRIVQSPRILCRASERLRGNPAFLGGFMEIHGWLPLGVCNDSIRNDATFVRSLVERMKQPAYRMLPEMLRDCGDEVLGNSALMRISCAMNGKVFRMAAEPLRRERDLLMTSLRTSGKAFLSADPALRQDLDVIVEAVASDLEVLKHLPSTLLADPSVMLAGLRAKSLHQYPPCCLHLFENSQELAARGVVIDPELLGHLPHALRDMEAVVGPAVEKNPIVFKSASRRLQSHEGFVERVVRKDGRAIQFACKELRAHERLARVAVTSGGNSPAEMAVTMDFGWRRFVARREGRDYVPPKGGRSCAYEALARDLRRDRAIALDAVRHNGAVFLFLPASFRADREIFDAALQNIHALFTAAAHDGDWWSSPKEWVQRLRSAAPSLRWDEPLRDLSREIARIRRAN